MAYALWIVQGAIGLILPGLLRIRPGLTPLAGGDVAAALISIVVGLFAAFVAYGRWRLAPSPRRPER